MNGRIRILPNPRQILFFLAKEKFLLYGGSKGGGKSWAIRTKQILRRFKYPKSKGLILRRTYPELLRNHIYKIREEWPMLQYNDQKHLFTFPNNPILMLADPDYIKELEKLPDTLRRAYLEGDWTIFAGQVFNEFRLDKHVITSFDYPLSQTIKIICFDWGYNAPGAALWLAYTSEGRVYAYREIYQNLKTPEQWAQNIKLYTDMEKVEYIVLPHDCFAKIHGNESIADVFKRTLNIPIKAAGTLEKGARHNRVAITHQYLSNAPDSIPFLQIHVSCRNLIRTLPELIYDKSDPEDVDTTGEDHLYDALSTGLMERVNRVTSGGVVKYEGPQTKPQEWTANPDGSILGPDFLKAFREQAQRRKSTAGIEFRR